MAKRTGSNVALWVALGILGLIVLGGIVVVIIAAMYMRSAEGQQFGDTLGKLQRIERAAPEIVGAFEKYLQANQDFPSSIEEIKASMSADSAKTCVEFFEYRKPAPEDPTSTIVMWTKDMPMLMGGEVRIEILKDLSSRQVQTIPLQSTKRKQAPAPAQ
jgi:hypothetical protein